MSPIIFHIQIVFLCLTSALGIQLNSNPHFWLQSQCTRHLTQIHIMTYNLQTKGKPVAPSKSFSFLKPICCSYIAKQSTSWGWGGISPRGMGVNRFQTKQRETDFLIASWSWFFFSILELIMDVWIIMIPSGLVLLFITKHLPWLEYGVIWGRGLAISNKMGNVTI